MSARSLFLASVVLLALAACHRDAAEPEAAPAPPPAAAKEVEPPRPPPTVSAPATPRFSADERRRALRLEKDGEAQVERTPEYEGASSAATALPSQGDDTPAAAAPPPPPPGQPPG